MKKVKHWKETNSKERRQMLDRAITSKFANMWASEFIKRTI